MGYLYVEHGICPVSHKILPTQEMETISCVHCQAVIRIILRGVEKAAETPYRCTRCHGSLCKHCAKEMHQHGGQCNGGIKAKIDHAVKTRKWNERFRHRFR